MTDEMTETNESLDGESADTADSVRRKQDEILDEFFANMPPKHVGSACCPHCGTELTRQNAALVFMGMTSEPHPLTGEPTERPVLGAYCTRCVAKVQH
jgi:hypothetical protein